jgi:hypothetical protein
MLEELFKVQSGTLRGRRLNRSVLAFPRVHLQKKMRDKNIVLRSIHLPLKALNYRKILLNHPFGQFVPCKAANDTRRGAARNFV